jgi:ribosome-binding ATPase YchF (GTP1/OBG family)
MKEDIRFMEEELILADLLMVETRQEKLAKELLKKKDPEAEKEKILLERLRPRLKQGAGIREASLSPQEDKLIRSFSFLSRKPLLHMINIDEKDLALQDDPAKICGLDPGQANLMAFCGKIETEILALDGDDDKRTFLSAYGLKEPVSDRFFQAALRLLGMIVFYTVGKEEVRAWPIEKTATALKAAAAIHSDIEQGFIRAEVISFEEFLRHGSLQAAKEKGAIRLEGKPYIVQDGDLIYFRFSQ